MIEGKIEITFSEEDRNRLDRIAALLKKLTTTDGYTMTFDESPFPGVVEITETVEEKTEAPADPKNEPAYKLADIQQKVVKLSTSGKKAEVKEIVKAYANNVSSIPEDKFGEVMTKLSALEGN